MARKTITQLTQLSRAGANRKTDLIPVWDADAAVTKYMTLADAIANLGVVDLRDWDIDFTGATNEAVDVQAWQDQAAADGRIAVAPPGVIGLGAKVTFKAPTIGAGGAYYGAQNPIPASAAVPYTAFKNTAINDGSWMIDVATTAGSQSSFGFLKGFRLHAGGLDVSLLRVLSLDSTPLGFSWEEAMADDIVAYGGRVNLEFFGYSLILRRLFSRAATMSACRTYLANALIVEGGWYGAANRTAWEFELFTWRSASGETIGSITFDHPVFQSRDAGGLGNGLRIAEGCRSVVLKTYHESHNGDESGGGIALQVGMNRAWHESGTIPTAVNIATTDSPSNDPRYAVIGVDLTGMKGGVNSAWSLLNSNESDRGLLSVGAQPGPRYQFGNVRGIKWHKSASLGARHVEYSRFSRDISGGPISNQMAAPTVTNPLTTTTAGVAGGVAVIPVANTTIFTASRKVYVTLVALTGRSAVHESDIASISPGVSITLSTPIPSDRSVASGAAVGHNLLDREYALISTLDPLSRGGEEALNLIPPGNFLGSVTTGTTGGRLRGVAEAYTNFADGRMEFATDYSVTRMGRPTLRLTRRGAAVPGTQVCRLWAYPWGHDVFAPRAIGVPVVVAGWIMVDDSPGFASTTFTSGSTHDSPFVGLAYSDGVTENFLNSSFSFTGTGRYFVPFRWMPFLFEYVINAPTVTKLGINLLPTGGGYSWSADGSAWFDSLGIFVNPRNYDAIREGLYQHNPGAGWFENGAFRASAAATPSSANTQIGKGDIFWNTDPAAGGAAGWIGVANGAPASSLKQFGVIAL
jgi:hypothetical protein